MELHITLEEIKIAAAKAEKLKIGKNIKKITDRIVNGESLDVPINDKNPNTIAIQRKGLITYWYNRWQESDKASDTKSEILLNMLGVDPKKLS